MVYDQFTADLFGFQHEPLPAQKPEPQRLSQKGTVVVQSPETYVSEAVCRHFSQPDLLSEYLVAEATGARCFVSGFTRAKVDSTPLIQDEEDLSQEDPNEVAEDEAAFQEAGLTPLTLASLAAEQAAWSPSEEEVRWLHGRCLDENLAFLSSRDRKDRVSLEKGHVLQWILCEDEIAGVHVSKIPFSFHNCCIAAGVDPDEMRSKLLQVPLVRALLVNLKFYPEAALPKLRKVVHYSDIAGPDASPDHPVYQFGW